MRVAQLDLVFRSLVESFGFNSFRLTNSPLWSYIEYLLQISIIDNQEKLTKLKNNKILTILKLYIMIFINRISIFILRNFLAAPLYRAAKAVMPDKMSVVLKIGQEIFATNKPHGELVPYTGEAIHKLRDGCDLFLNIAPEGCIVSSMGEAATMIIMNRVGAIKKQARIQGLFSLDGEIDIDRLDLALLKLSGPVDFFRNRAN